MNARSIDGLLPVSAGLAALSLLLPWSESGGNDRNSIQLVRSAGVVDAISDSTRWLLVGAWGVVVVLAAGSIVAMAWGRVRLTALLGTPLGLAMIVAAVIVERSPLPLRWGAIVGCGAGLVAAVRSGVILMGNDDATWASPLPVSARGPAAATFLVVALAGSGGYAALSAGTEPGGAESPEQAMELMLEAVAAGDYLAAAEYVVPTERKTLVGAGLHLADELARLELSADDLGLAAFRGFDLNIAAVEIRRETPRNGVAHLFLESGVVTASIDGADLVFGPIVGEQVLADFFTFADGDVTAIQPASMPIVAVEREGRWYLSLWYTVAENVRLNRNLALPDLARRPAAIGGETPEDAVLGLLDEVVRLDVRRMIGMLDPVEASALYDYSPLFLDEVVTSANELLNSLGDEGWSWAFEDLVLSSSVDGDDARVAIESVDFAASSDAGSSLDLEIRADHLRFVLDSADFWGDPYSVVGETVGDCLIVTYKDPVLSQTKETCAELLGDQRQLTDSPRQPSGLSLNLHRVDGRWFISPTATLANAVVDMLAGYGPRAMLVYFWPGGTIAHDQVIAPSLVDSARSFESLENLDLLVDGPVAAFAYDDNLGAELQYWLPEIELSVDRGIYVSVDTGDGQLALVVYELAKPIEGSLEDLFAGDASVSESSDWPVVVLEVEDAFGEVALVAVDGTRFVLVGGYGAELSLMEAQLVAQLG